MRTKFLIAVLVVSFILLVYSLACYRILNKRIEMNTRNSISTYFNTYLSDVSSYEFIQAVSNEKDTFKVFVKTQDDYYTFYFSIYGQEFQLQNVELGVPSYIS